MRVQDRFESRILVSLSWCSAVDLKLKSGATLGSESLARLSSRLIFSTFSVLTFSQILTQEYMISVYHTARVSMCENKN